jgi:hypothetical protein
VLELVLLELDESSDELVVLEAELEDEVDAAAAVVVLVVDAAVESVTA